MTAGSPRRTVRAAAVAIGAAAAMVLFGCASTKAPTDVDLGGQWQLDAASSDNVDARVTQAVDRAEARQSQRMRTMAAQNRARGLSSGDEMGQPGSEPVVSVPFIGTDFKQLHQHLLQILTAPSTLRLDVQDQTVTIQSDRLPARDYQPDEPFVRFDEYGNAKVSANWSGPAFVLHERYMSHATLTERYEVDAKSGTLTYTRQLKDPTVGTIELKSVYHHA
jgi:hypothetical protein